MTFAALVALVFGLVALLLYAFLEVLFLAVFGYLGASMVWLLSLGRVRMDSRRGGESALASTLGMVFTVFLAVGLCYLFQRS